MREGDCLGYRAIRENWFEEPDQIEVLVYLRPEHQLGHRAGWLAGICAPSAGRTVRVEARCLVDGCSAQGLPHPP